jgi:hypothetical protein
VVAKTVLDARQSGCGQDKSLLWDPSRPHWD